VGGACLVLMFIAGFALHAQNCPPAVSAYEQIAVPDNVLAGEIVTITAKVKNTSCEAIGPFDVSAYYDSIDQGHLVATQTVPGLDPCEEITLTFQWDTTGVPPGTYPVWVWADSSEQFNHEFEDDNTCSDDAEVTVRPAPLVDATKAYTDDDGGVPLADDRITYEVQISNTGTGEQPDVAGSDEFVDVIPDWTTFVAGSATASSGTVVYDAGGNRILWNGAVPVGDTVTIRFAVTIAGDAAQHQRICNQGIVFWDQNADGVNEAQEPTDNPATGAVNDPTCFLVDAPPPPVVPMAFVGTIDAPTLSEWGAIAFGSLLALAVLWMGMRRRRLLHARRQGVGSVE